jgi:hypothetical protein
MKGAFFMGLFKPNVMKLYRKNNVVGLIKAVSHKDTDVRLQSIHFIEKLKDARAVPALVAALRDAERRVRDAAVYALGEIGSKEAALPLIEFLKGESKFSDERGLAEQALQKIGLPVDPTIQARYHVANLDYDGAVPFGSAAVEPLLEALNDLDRDVRRSVAHALVRLYNGGKMDEEARQKILAKRDAISQPHIDGGNVCNIPHYDYGAFGLP